MFPLFGVYNFESSIKKAHNHWLYASCAPDEIRTHIDGTGNHNSIH
jgi:hypothetical protein